MKQIPGDTALPPEFVTRTAGEKADWLWEHLILATRHEPSELPTLRMPFQSQPLKELAVVCKRDELEKALTRTEDVMEPGRPKVIHAFGSVARIELETDEASPFTGLLAAPPDGGAIGLLRMSLVASVARNRAFTPGIGLKFFVDGAPSADLLAMNHTVGQGRDFDLFSNTMTNDLSDEHEELRPPQKIMGVMFDRVSHRPRRLVSDHLTSQTRRGAAVHTPVTPRRLVFTPTAEAHQVFEGQAGVDFRLVLQGVEAGTPLWRVDGLMGVDPQPVGLVRTTSPFVSSDGGDRLFFRHVQDPRDRKH